MPYFKRINYNVINVLQDYIFGMMTYIQILITQSYHILFLSIFEYSKNIKLWNENIHTEFMVPVILGKEKWE